MGLGQLSPEQITKMKKSHEDRSDNWDNVPGGNIFRAIEKKEQMTNRPVAVNKVQEVFDDFSVRGKETLPPAGYHLRPIPRGKLGSISKIEEELAELKDAREQRCKLMELQELSDLYGATQAYLEHRFPGFTMQDLKHMAKITARAFECGERCSR